VEIAASAKSLDEVVVKRTGLKPETVRRFARESDWPPRTLQTPNCWRRCTRRSLTKRHLSTDCLRQPSHSLCNTKVRACASEQKVTYRRFLDATIAQFGACRG
jgi:hypothetical protein